jgi:DNA-binding PadR family transcriptional regulator
VLRAFLNEPGQPLYGYDLMQAAKLKSGTLYPILSRLTAEGWVTRTAEAIDPAVEGRPARRYYQLTAVGAAEARQAFAEAYEAVGPGRAGVLPGRLAEGGSR